MTVELRATAAPLGWATCQQVATASRPSRRSLLCCVLAVRAFRGSCGSRFSSAVYISISPTVSSLIRLLVCST